MLNTEAGHLELTMGMRAGTLGTAIPEDGPLGIATPPASPSQQQQQQQQQVAAASTNGPHLLRAATSAIRCACHHSAAPANSRQTGSVLCIYAEHGWSEDLVETGHRLAEGVRLPQVALQHWRPGGGGSGSAVLAYASGHPERACGGRGERGSQPRWRHAPGVPRRASRGATQQRRPHVRTQKKRVNNVQTGNICLKRIPVKNYRSRQRNSLFMMTNNAQTMLAWPAALGYLLKVNTKRS